MGCKPRPDNGDRFDLGCGTTAVAGSRSGTVPPLEMDAGVSEVRFCRRRLRVPVP